MSDQEKVAGVHCCSTDGHVDVVRVASADDMTVLVARYDGPRRS